MPPQPRSDLRSWARQGLLVALVAAPACNEADPPTPASESTPAPPPGPATLVVELPAGVEVSLDGAKRRAAPIEALEVEPGEHTLTLVTACQEVELRIEATAGQTTRVDPERAEGLRLTTLEITARDLDGNPLAHTVALDERVIARGEGSSKLTVPACKHRMTVASEGLGSFIEDIDLTEPTMSRDLVLSPGPDMVRIHGGPFTLGPPESSVRTPGRWDLSFPRKDVVFATFDMDRTEVTAAQFHECRVSGRCLWVWSRDISIVDWPKFPPAHETRHCTTALDYGTRTPVPGRETHPMNCVSLDEAKMYCAAVGKRLPTAAEWEYAARSRNPAYYCPWAPSADASVDNASCSRGREWVLETHPVCTYFNETSEQGLCDLASNVAELVTDEHIAWKLEDYVPTRGGWNRSPNLTMFDKSLPYDRRAAHAPTARDQDVTVGFRCVREASHTSN